MGAFWSIKGEEDMVRERGIHEACTRMKCAVVVTRPNEMSWWLVGGGEQHEAICVYSSTEARMATTEALDMANEHSISAEGSRRAQ